MPRVDMPVAIQTAGILFSLGKPKPAKRVRRWCWYCKHGVGERFHIPFFGGREGWVMCGHPDPAIRSRRDPNDIPDLRDPLRKAFDHCEEWTPCKKR